MKRVWIHFTVDLTEGGAATPAFDKWDGHRGTIETDIGGREIVHEIDNGYSALVAVPEGSHVVRRGTSPLEMSHRMFSRVAISSALEICNHAVHGRHGFTLIEPLARRIA